MNKKVIYTSIFGSEYYLHEPSIKLNGWDYICFTDNTDYKSDKGRNEQTKPNIFAGGMALRELQKFEFIFFLF